MSFVDREPLLILDSSRLLLGTIAAPLAGSLAAALFSRNFVVFWPVAGFGFLSVLFLYLPLIAWTLPRTRRPFLTCVLLGGIAAPGPLGYIFMAFDLAEGSGGLAAAIFTDTAPLGLVGGLVFWSCVAWNNPGIGDGAGAA